MSSKMTASDTNGDTNFETLHFELQEFNDSGTNATLKFDQASEILQRFYDDLNKETNYFLITLYVPIIVLAVTANILVVVVVYKYHYMRSPINYFVVNLSVADLLVTMICMPMAVSQAVSIVWVYGETMCKFFFYLQGVSVAASVFTITAMSIDRYLAIRSPIALRRGCNRKCAILVIAGLWMVALGIFTPLLRAVTLHSPITDLGNITLVGKEEVKTPPPFYVCSEDFKPVGIQPPIFGTFCFVLVYAVPGFIVVLAYSMMGRTLCARKPPFDSDSIKGSASSQQGFKLVRERRRVAWVLLLLAVLFALCWLPYNVLQLLIDLEVFGNGSDISNLVSYCLFLGHANSALNPMVYCFMTRNFRESVSEILCRTPHGLTRRKPHRKTVGATEDDCVGFNMEQGNLVMGREGATPLRVHAVTALQRTATSSSSYDSFCKRYPQRKSIPQPLPNDQPKCSVQRNNVLQSALDRPAHQASSITTPLQEHTYVHLTLAEEQR
ncbi:orexin receptor type 1 [Orussus abietinus]|uniref:orexin receptor type 1 n=1 Tax=Orussus abietinus TaxID=222816 RepID=UPI000625ADB6|nr:orexin receptor type 1 [Orussus abietinus]